MPEIGRHRKFYPETFQPFPTVPTMSLRLFGIMPKDMKVPALPDRGVRAQGHHRYKLFREGVAQLLELEGREHRDRAGAIAGCLLRGALSPEFFEYEAGQNLTYKGEALDSRYVHAELRRTTKAHIKMAAIDVLQMVGEGKTPEAWQQLHDESIALAAIEAEATSTD
jgi:hypothetical protein